MRRQRTILNFFRDSRILSAKCREEVAERNRITLKYLCILYGVILVGYAVFSLFAFDSTQLHMLYLCFLVLHIVFCALTYRQITAKNSSAGVVTLLCVCFLSMLMAFIISISLFPFPDQPAIYFSMILVASSVVFSLPFDLSLTLTTLYTALFITGVFLTKDSISIAYDVSAAVGGFIVACVCSFIVTDMRLREIVVRSQLEYLSATDELTGLSNKSTTEYLCQSYLDRRGPDSLCALFVIDLDNFKDINDTYGHAQGDELLRRTGARLRGLFRESDVTGRVGGDEFLILMKDISDPAIAERKARQIIDELGLVFSAELFSRVSCSVGGIIAGPENSSYRTLFSRADQALYQAKTVGRHRAVFYTPPACNGTDRNCLLIADDDEVSRAILRSCFETEYTVLEAETGVQAMDYIERFNSQLAVVLLDIEMPGMRGTEVLEHVRSNHLGGDFPILVVTAHTKQERSYLELGAADIIAKPFDVKVVQMRVQNAVHKARS